MSLKNCVSASKQTRIVHTSNGQAVHSHVVYTLSSCICENCELVQALTNIIQEFKPLNLLSQTQTDCRLTYASSQDYPDSILFTIIFRNSFTSAVEDKS